MSRSKGHNARRRFVCGKCGSVVQGHMHITVHFGAVCRICSKKSLVLSA
jgi:DNA-directed RNA polymerase subunit RPC12/RpoP